MTAKRIFFGDVSVIYKKFFWNLLFLLPTLVTRLFFNSKRVMTTVFKGEFALNGLDRSISSQFNNLNGFFLEVGGNDGFSQSNTKRLELFLGWSGILVEPYLPNFRRIAKTRTSRTLPVHAACVPFGFLGPNVSLIYSDLMTSSLGMESDVLDPKKHSEEGAKWIRSGRRVREFKAPARTLNSILKTADAPSRIDFFSLDVEGVELSVLKGVDHETFRFTWLLVESRDQEKLNSYLTSLGYELAERVSQHDYLYRDAKSSS
jgi:FkbM family methyltransferase